MYSPFLDLSYPVHCVESRMYKFAIITDGNVSSLFELYRRILVRNDISAMWYDKKECKGSFTMVISFPAALRNALVHRTFRGFRFILGGCHDTGPGWIQ